MRHSNQHSVPPKAMAAEYVGFKPNARRLREVEYNLTTQDIRVLDSMWRHLPEYLPAFVFDLLEPSVRDTAKVYRWRYRPVVSYGVLTHRVPPFVGEHRIGYIAGTWIKIHVLSSDHQAMYTAAAQAAAATARERSRAAAVAAANMSVPVSGSGDSVHSPSSSSSFDWTETTNTFFGRSSPVGN